MPFWLHPLPLVPCRRNSPHYCPHRRFDGDEGLPYGNITSIVTTTVTVLNGLLPSPTLRQNEAKAAGATATGATAPSSYAAAAVATTTSAERMTQIWLGTTKGVVVIHGGAIAGGTLPMPATALILYIAYPFLCQLLL
jgi:hypothetical protein